MGTTRTMRTTAMMGEVVGMAAALCHKHSTTPRGVYHHFLPELKEMMKRGAGAPSETLPDNQNFNFGKPSLPAPRAMMPAP